MLNIYSHNCELEQKARGVSRVLRMKEWKRSSERGRVGGQPGSRLRAAGSMQCLMSDLPEREK